MTKFSQTLVRNLSSLQVSELFIQVDSGFYWHLQRDLGPCVLKQGTGQQQKQGHLIGKLDFQKRKGVREKWKFSNSIGPIVQRWGPWVNWCTLSVPCSSTDNFMHFPSHWHLHIPSRGVHSGTILSYVSLSLCCASGPGAVANFNWPQPETFQPSFLPTSFFICWLCNLSSARRVELPLQEELNLPYCPTLICLKSEQIIK